MPYTDAALTRLAHAQVCSYASDQARRIVATVFDTRRRPGSLVNDTHALTVEVDWALELAVAAERANGVSWEVIGKALGVSRQAAHRRFADAVQEIADGVVFPIRTFADGTTYTGGLGEGFEEHDRLVRLLDEWSTRDPNAFGNPHMVSQGLRSADAERRIEGPEELEAFARRVRDGDVPEGVTPAMAHQVLLERTVRAHEMRAERATSGEERAEAVQRANAARDELVAWNRAAVVKRLAHKATADPDRVVILVDTVHVRDLRRVDADDPTARGWFLQSVDPYGQVDGRMQERVADVDCGREDAIAAGLDCVADRVAGDLALSIEPTDGHGITGWAR